jgi:hypothetical protein
MGRKTIMAPENAVWKYSYWLDKETFEMLECELRDKKIEMIRAKQNPCEALQGTVGCAEPHTWSVICKYDAAPWYLASPHAGEYLVVSSFPLDERYRPFLETTIEPVSFTPPRMATQEEMVNLASDTGYLAKEPSGWCAFPKEMTEAIMKGLAQMSGSEPEPWESLLRSWNAVHANFANPKLRADETFSRAPYSITDTSHIGTCCVEVFNLLGSQEESLLVRPCIGAAIVKVLEKDKYYLIKPSKKLS